uniref:small glutamine-rich tetratricopeptide repeat-containing protein alpha-like n=1 Tax=Myxine glutinosa TaxID=7769 RepID=UPI00358FCEEF
MSDEQRLAFAVLGFLTDHRRTGGLSKDAQESAEVAIQCLENVFGIGAHDKHLSISTPLLEAFRDAMQKEPAALHGIVRPEVLMNGGIVESDSVPPADRTKAEKLKNQGNDLMKEEAYLEALDYYTRAIELDRRNSVYFCNRAAAYSKLGNYEATVLDCEKALAIDPNYSKAYGRKGLALTNLGKLREASDCYRQAVELDPDNESFRINLELMEQRVRSKPSPSGSMPGGFDLAGILNNPSFMNMATSLMQNPEIQRLMAGMMSGGFSGGVSGLGTTDMGGLIQAGQQLAQQMQQHNPELIEQLRNQIRSRPPSASFEEPPQPPSL